MTASKNLQAATYLAAIRELLEALEASPDDMDVHKYETIVDGAKAHARHLLKRAAQEGQLA